MIVDVPGESGSRFGACGGAVHVHGLTVRVDVTQPGDLRGVAGQL